MSEFQYYEFRAVDRPLKPREREELRKYSTRAQITATTFRNHYEWGDFKGDTNDWMDYYFDAFLYYANWGSREVKLRIPRQLVEEAALTRYCSGTYFEVRESGTNLVLTFSVEELQEEYDLDWEGLLDSMIPIRDELMQGDLRSLYLGWLIDATHATFDGQELEPPVPPGLAELTEAQQALIDFFQIDEDLLAAALQWSPPLEQVSSPREQINRWLAQIDPAEKDDLLARLLSGEEPHLGQELYSRAAVTKGECQETGRTVTQFFDIAEELREVREKREAEEEAEEKARREHQAALARTKHLDSLVGRGSILWAQVEELTAMKIGARYDEAVTRLVDLQELAERGDPNEFYDLVATFRMNHANKPSLLKRLHKVGL